MNIRAIGAVHIEKVEMVLPDICIMSRWQTDCEYLSDKMYRRYQEKQAAVKVDWITLHFTTVFDKFHFCFSIKIPVL